MYCKYPEVNLNSWMWTWASVKHAVCKQWDTVLSMNTLNRGNTSKHFLTEVWPNIAQTMNSWIVLLFCTHKYKLTNHILLAVQLFSTYMVMSVYSYCYLPQWLYLEVATYQALRTREEYLYTFFLQKKSILQQDVVCRCVGKLCLIFDSVHGLCNTKLWVHSEARF